MNRPLGKAIVTGLGTGYLPVAPGTWGSAAVFGLFLLVARATDGHAAWINAAMLAVLVGASVACVALGRFAETAFARKDPRQCTIDEWAGQALTFVLLPAGAGWWDWVTVGAIGFACFRLFDIVKLPPARRLEKLPYGWGVLCDDLAAGLYANVLAQLLVRHCYGL